MKKKIIAIMLTAALALIALPAAAFAAGSLPDSQTATTNGVAATLVGSSENINELVVEPESAALTWDVYFTSGTTDNFGTLTLTFPVGDQYNGQTATITVTHHDGTVDTSTQVVSGGVVSVSMTKLSTVTISFSDTSSSSSSNASSTSPKTGADMTWLYVLTCVAAAGAAGALVARKRIQG